MTALGRCRHGAGRETSGTRRYRTSRSTCGLRMTFWTAPAECNGDGAFGRTEIIRSQRRRRACKSGLAFLFPPHYKAPHKNIKRPYPKQPAPEQPNNRDTVPTTCRPGALTRRRRLHHVACCKHKSLQIKQENTKTQKNAKSNMFFLHSEKIIPCASKFNRRKSRI